MRAMMVMFDSLNRKMLSPYGCDWTKTPNFARLEEKTLTFDTCFVGSMPCMPARRELLTGRYNFLHRTGADGVLWRLHAGDFPRMRSLKPLQSSLSVWGLRKEN